MAPVLQASLPLPGRPRLEDDLYAVRRAVAIQIELSPGQGDGFPDGALELLEHFREFGSEPPYVTRDQPSSKNRPAASVTTNKGLHPSAATKSFFLCPEALDGMRAATRSGGCAL